MVLSGTDDPQLPHQLYSTATDSSRGRHCIRDLDTIRQMEHIVAKVVGKRLMYRDLIADTGTHRSLTR